MSNSRYRFALSQPSRIVSFSITALFAAMLVGCGGENEQAESEERTERIAPVATVEVEDPEAATEEEADEAADQDAAADENGAETAADDSDAADEAEQVAEADADAEGRSGEEVYETYCTACHAAGVAGAPKTGDEGDWEERMAKGVDENVTSVIEGLGAMPPRGGGADLTDEEIRHAVIYLFNRAGGDY